MNDKRVRILTVNEWNHRWNRLRDLKGGHTVINSERFFAPPQVFVVPPEPEREL